MPSNSTKLKAPGSSSRRKANSIPKVKPLTASRPTQSYVVIDATLPSHIINDRSLFTTYTPSRRVHRTAFGNNITIEGVGDAHFRVFAAGKFILFCMRNCWHVPSSLHHFLSCPAITSIGCQVMFASRTPRLLFSHKRRLSEPDLPKYVPLTKMDGYFVLKYEIPLPGSVFFQTALTTSRVTAVSLHSSTYQPFSGLPVPSQPHSPSSRSPQSHNSVSPSPPLHFSAFPFIHRDPSTLQSPEKVPISQPFLSPQRPSLSEPLPVLHNFTIPSFNPPSATPFPIISYPIPTFNPQSIQQLPHTPPLFAHTSDAIHPMSHSHSQARCRTHPSLGSVQPRLLPFPSDSRDTLISRSLPLHPPILSSIPSGPFLNTLLVQQCFGPRPIPPRLKTP